MPQISIETTTFERLQKRAVPLVDTFDTVIIRALNALDYTDKTPPSQTPRQGVDLVIDQKNIPNLTHTKIFSAKFDDNELPRSNWNSLLDETLLRVRKSGLKATDIRRIGGINVQEGRKTIEGYRFLDQIGLSVQGQDSNAACRGILSLARHIGAKVDIEFTWREKDGAAHPGKSARVSSS